MKAKSSSVKRFLFEKGFILFLFLLLLSQVSFAQKIKVSGTIVDNNNSPLPGVTIVEKGTTNGVISDVDGNFTINVKNQESVLRFSSIGFVTQETTVGTNTTLQIHLAENLEVIDEVVVTGYGVQKKSDLTGAVSSISSEKLTSMPVIGADQALQGRASGVSVTQNTGMPGSSVSIQIRGISSINGTEPIVIVDGVRGSLSDLNPDDIQSIEILKDASSAAIYGSSGGNGVILVTTKKGKAGKIRANFNHYTGWQKPWKKMDMMNSQELAEMMNYANAMKNQDLFTTQPDTLSNYDYQDIMFRTALMQNYDLSVSGGSDVSSFYMSANYEKQEGILRKSDYDRIGFRINSSHQLNKFIKIGENAQFTKSSNIGYEEWEFQSEYNTPMTNILTMYPYIPPYDENGNWSENPTGGANPMVAQDVLDKRRDNYSIGANAYLELSLFKGFVFTSKVNAYTNFNRSNNFDKVYHYNPTTYNDHSKITKSISQQKGWEIQNYFNYNTTIANDHDLSVMGGYEAARTSYDGIHGSRLDLINETPEMQYFDASGDQESALQFIQGGGWEDARFAYFGRVNYSYKGKYLLTSNVRKDYSSRFGPNYRSGVFPSFSLGWKFSEEGFMKNADFINFAKLRFGWGQTGANAPERYAYYARVNSTLNAFTYIFDQSANVSQGAFLQKMPNPEMHWETIEMSNLGLDLGLFDNEMTMSVDLFSKRNLDMLMSMTLPAITGMYIAPNLTGWFGGNANPITNVGKFENRGVEVSLGYKKSVGDFKVDADLNFSFIKNEVININGDSIYGGRNGVSLQNFTLTSEGFPVSQFNGFETDGLYTWDDVIYDARGNARVFRLTNEGDTVIMNRGVMPGDLKFVDRNGDGKIGPEDKTNIGSPIPKFIFGFSTNLSYKNFDLNMFFEGKIGNKIFNGTKWWLMQQTIDGNRLSLMLDQYREDIVDDNGDVIIKGNTDTDVPRFDPKDPNQNFTQVSDFYVEDGSYIRLKNLQLGYNFNTSLVQKIGLENLRVYVGAKNLLTFTRYTGFDPEVGSSNVLEQGIDKAGNYPHNRMLLVGVNVQF